MTSEKQIHNIIAGQLPDFTANSALTLLDGGNLNHVWRLEGEPQNLIIKWAPPYIASNPEVPLSTDRIHFEAKSLELFSKGHQLTHITSSGCRPPHLLYFSREHDLIIMEDVGPAPSITEWIDAGGDITISQELGRFIGLLHNETYHQPELAGHFHNSDIQQTRRKVQYDPAAEYVSNTGRHSVDSNFIKSKTKTLGQKLLEPGKCLIMGDLWPPSILMGGGNLRLIDWEFVHYGRPLQDVGHFAAHCWMQAHANQQQGWGRQLWNYFWDSYRQALGNTFDELYDEQEWDNMATHIGAEILVRAVGPFKQGYVYEEYGRQARLIDEAAQKAVTMIESSYISPLWDA